MVYVSLLKGKVFRLFLSVIVSLIFYPIAGYSAIFNVTNEDELRQALSIAESNGEDDSLKYNALENEWDYCYCCYHSQWLLLKE